MIDNKSKHTYINPTGRYQPNGNSDLNRLITFLLTVLLLTWGGWVATRIYVGIINLDKPNNEPAAESFYSY